MVKRHRVEANTKVVSMWQPYAFEHTGRFCSRQSQERITLCIAHCVFENKVRSHKLEFKKIKKFKISRFQATKCL